MSIPPYNYHRRSEFTEKFSHCQKYTSIGADSSAHLEVFLFIIRLCFLRIQEMLRILLPHHRKSHQSFLYTMGLQYPC